MKDHQCHSLVHSQLAALPVKEYITTNYDKLFELASEAVDLELAVLPYEPTADSDRWLLKLHGCLGRPDDIVLTRADYLRYDERRAALRGIVQAMLITRHMLFVGFSLGDDNFLRIVEDVRKAVRGEGSAAAPTTSSVATFGTSLMLKRSPWFDELWQEDVEMVHFSDGETGGFNPEAARRLEVFLDYLGAHSIDSSEHLLAPTYDAILTDAERSLATKLKRLIQDLDSAEKSTMAWQNLAATLRQLGNNE
jgi:hypothetical protein